jgi:hypothetical protein
VGVKLQPFLTSSYAAIAALFPGEITPGNIEKLLFRYEKY